MSNLDTARMRRYTALNTAQALEGLGIKLPADVARAMALPVFGGMTIELITLFVVPVVFCSFQEISLNLGRLESGTQS